MAALPPVPRFFMYEGSELDFGWMARCPRFAELRASPTNERLAEVEMRSLLVSSDARTRDPTLATLFYVPLWEVVSFRVGRCENTTHRDRMRAAWSALRVSPYWKPRRGRPAGADHLLASTGCVEDNLKLSQRLGNLLGPLLIPTIFGRDRAYSPYYKYSGIGRCTVEIPYVSNPHATALRRARGAYPAGDEPFGGALSLSETDDYRAAGLSDEQASDPPVSHCDEANGASEVRGASSSAAPRVRDAAPGRATRGRRAQRCPAAARLPRWCSPQALR